MPLKFSNSQEFLSKLQQYINILIAIPMMAFIVLFLKIENRTYHPEILNEDMTFYLRIISLIGVLVMVGLGWYAFKKGISSLNTSMAIRNKLELFYSASMTRSYYFEAATFLTLIGLALTAEQLYVGFYTICLVAFSITYPTIYRINSQLRLNKEERGLIISRKKIK